MAKRIEDIEGIGSKFGELLRNEGIRTPAQLLKQGATPQGRKHVSERSGIDEQQILKWVNMCDLFRIKGVAGQYAELLEAVGVDTVKELRNRNPENLAEKIREVNAQRRLVRQKPTNRQIQDWVEHAKSLEPVITY